MDTEHRVFRRTQLRSVTGLSLTTLYRLMKLGTFPRPVQLSTQAVGWLVADVEAWLRSRPAKAADEAMT